MKWLEIRIKTTEEAYDAISDMLTNIGAGGVAIEDPHEIKKEIEKHDSLDYADDNFINSLGEDVVIKAYFPGNSNINELAELIKEKLNFIANFLNVGEGYDGYSELNEEDWATSWKKYYKPFYISDRIVIKPSWEEYDNRQNEIVIELDPGMAFGTGTHETTRMCSQLLERYMKPGDSVIDVGCGTGILSIVASKLGASRITAVDVDEVAVRVSKENCQLNGVNHITVFKGTLDEIEKNKVDLLVANIIAKVIIDISEIMPYYVKTGGYFVSSGIIKERKEDVIEAYSNVGFSCESILELGEWVAIVFKCQGSS
ncbi:MAG: 50S ribosomal protein L11 methyltransferase [Clostridia bacterium]|nr:50S ribosomal protein L11 methyltransferase [Clostridia bacterium]